ncbi:hypothetical protein [uncultured Anaeromusa sp.]|uniref:TRAFAC clade GTPase domain-containing protein n=1 Tax=uncultured Anaeromusa sp. TaxID=673273 RepID=UPI0029C7F0D3|nr:hypothetical protein [uncultured Anaeromusa sp.]
MNAKSCFIMGLPEAGKTTYLAALWYCLSQPDKNVLKLKKYSNNHKYLAQLSETWLSGSKVSRTNIHAEEKTLTLTLKGCSNEEYEVTFPDLSGETFQRQYIDREIGSDIAECVCQCDGILYFVNPLKIEEPHLISDVPEHLRPSNVDSREVTLRNPTQSDPIDVQLVELLQFVKYLREDEPVRLGMVVSAWDTIRESKYDIPEKFIKENLPLFWQYLLANQKIFDVFYFGVSAQGNSLESQADKDEVLKIEDQTERIIVVDNDKNRSTDITMPLWMALNKEGE